jgi:calcineurin-like phosphoesterase family protein
MIYFTSDHHFGHANIIKFVNRPFKTVEQMDEELISRWNETVSEDDIVYHLGDFTLGNRKVFNSYIKRLSGHIKIVPGGHDSRWLKNFPISGQVEILPLMVIDSSLLPIKDGRHVPLTLCHYPMYSWDRSHYGAPHLHGHTHGTIGVKSFSGDMQLPPNQRQGVRIDIGVDNWNFYPVSLDDIIQVVERT